jgi:uridylate kinase
VVLFAASTRQPVLHHRRRSSALRATEIGADLLLKATKVNGVYDADPVKVRPPSVMTA